MANGLPALYNLIESGSGPALDFWRQLMATGSVQMLPFLMDMLKDKDTSEAAQTYALETLTNLVYTDADFREAFLALEDGVRTLVGVSLHGGDFVMSYHEPPAVLTDSDEEEAMVLPPEPLTMTRMNSTSITCPGPAYAIELASIGGNAR